MSVPIQFHEDPTREARGVLVGLSVALILWAVVALVAYRVLS